MSEEINRNTHTVPEVTSRINLSFCSICKILVSLFLHKSTYILCFIAHIFYLFYPHILYLLRGASAFPPLLWYVLIFLSEYLNVGGDTDHI